MWRPGRAGLLAGAVLAVVAQGALAADIAMIVGTAAEPSEEIVLLGDVLNARGYEVYDRHGAGREDLGAALKEIAARLSETERLILVYVGEVQAQGAQAWLLPEGFSGAGRIDAALAGLPLGLLLDLAAEVPGRSAVVIGAEAGDAPARAVFPDLALGVGAPVPPQGVLMMAGPPSLVIGAAIEGLLGDAASVAEALAETPEGVEVFGFRSPEAAFTPE